MKAVYLSLAVLALTSQAYSQCIPNVAAGIAPVYPNCGCGPAPAIVAAPAPVYPNCGCGPAPAIVAAPAPAIVAAPTMVAANSVAANLADTLSLLTVTTLLAETLPYSCPAVAPVPVGYPGCVGGYGYLL